MNRFHEVECIEIAVDEYVPWSGRYYKSLRSNCPSRWLRGLWRGSVAARLLGLWVRIPLGPWMFVCFECCVLSGRRLCVGLITLPEESYRLWCVVACDLETSWMRRPWPTVGLLRQKRSNYVGCFELPNSSRREPVWRDTGKDDLQQMTRTSWGWFSDFGLYQH